MLNMIEMKRFAILCGVIAAFLCLSQNAHAQYRLLQRDKGALVDELGTPLSDVEIRNMIGAKVFMETYAGAKKQYAAGRKLIAGGIPGTIVGTGAMVGAAFYASKHAEKRTDGQIVFDSDESATLAGALFAGGAIMAGLSAVALQVGIPLAVIGKKRLDWVADNYNAGQEITYHFGAAPSGVGLTLNF